MAEDVLARSPEMIAALPKSISYDDFLRWEGPSEQVEWVAGTVVPMSPVTAEHQQVALFLLRVVSEFVERSRLGRVFHEPFQMKTGSDLPGRAPDLLVLLNADLAR